MNTPHERLTRTTFSLPLGEVHALVGGAAVTPGKPIPGLFALAAILQAD